VAGTCICGNKPLGAKKAGNFLTSYGTVGFSRTTLLHGVSKYIFIYLLTCSMVQSPS